MKEFTLNEVSQHNSKDSLWIIIDDHVFDVTDFKNHPGGYNILLKNGGKDCTKLFDEFNHVDAYRLLDDFVIGKLRFLS